MNEKRHDRRDFFREFVKRVVEPAVEALDTGAAAQPLVILRPPGALPEPNFLSSCERCRACVEACPADAIRPIEVDGPLYGTPGIVASDQPCVVCTDLDCMTACPSGALRILPREEIDLGTAIVDEDVCLRAKGEACRICVDFCPLGETAMRVDEKEKVAVLDGCVGCGVCEHVCPTSPKAVRIDPGVRLNV